MSYLEAITKIVAALAWPAATIIIVCMLRSGVLKVLKRFAEHVGRLKTARGPGGIHLAFDVPKFPPPIPGIKEIGPD